MHRVGVLRNQNLNRRTLSIITLIESKGQSGTREDMSYHDGREPRVKVWAVDTLKQSCD